MKTKKIEFGFDRDQVRAFNELEKAIFQCNLYGLELFADTDSKSLGVVNLKNLKDYSIINKNLLNGRQQTYNEKTTISFAEHTQFLCEGYFRAFSLKDSILAEFLPLKRHTKTGEQSKKL
jgi:hypothetical protein